MTKKELIEALSEYSDDDEIKIKDIRYYSSECLERDVFLLDVIESMCAGKKTPLLRIESSHLVQDVMRSDYCCGTCKHFDLPKNGPLYPCGLGRRTYRECYIDNRHYEFFNKQ
jgi:hypothetical protein